MPQLVSDGPRLYKVNMAKNCIDVSYTKGVLWVSRSRMGSKFGRLKDLLWFHNHLFALTDTGIWFSNNQGSDWGCRGSSKTARSMVALQDGGKNLQGLHQDGHLYESYNEGADWRRLG